MAVVATITIPWVRAAVQNTTDRPSSWRSDLLESDEALLLCTTPTVGKAGHSIPAVPAVPAVPSMAPTIAVACSTTASTLTIRIGWALAVVYVINDRERRSK